MKQLTVSRMVNELGRFIQYGCDNPLNKKEKETYDLAVKGLDGLDVLDFFFVKRLEALCTSRGILQEESKGQA